MTLQDLIQAVNDGVLTIIARPDGMTLAQCNMLHLGETWLWQINYDNLALLTRRDDPAEVIRSISLSPAHALLLGTLIAWQRDFAKLGVVL